MVKLVVVALAIVALSVVSSTAKESGALRAQVRFRAADCAQKGADWKYATQQQKKLPGQLAKAVEDHWKGGIGFFRNAVREKL